MSGYSDLKYVLGYGFDVIPVERAIIKVGDNCYDPMWTNHNFVGLWEMPAEQLVEFVGNKQRVPLVSDWIELSLK